MSALCMTLNLLEQKVARTSHSTSLMQVSDVKWYETVSVVFLVVEVLKV